MSSPSVKLGPFALGVNTRLPDTSLGTRDGRFLRSAVNVDLTEDGKIRRRKGITLVQAAAAATHSLFSADGRTGFYMDGATLNRVRSGPGGLASTQVRSDMTPGLRASYAQVGTAVYYANGLDSGILNSSAGDISGWGALPPTNDPTLASYLFRPLPVGTIVRYYKGQLLSVVGSTLFVSEPYAFNVYDPQRGFVPFNRPIQVVAVTDDGVYVCTDAGAYWLAGDLLEAVVDQKLPYGAIPGSDYQVPNSNDVMWMSPRGLVKGTTSGETTNLQEASVDTTAGRVGATLFRELDGLKKVVTSVFGSDTSKASAASFMSAEIVRKGTVL